MRALDLRSRTAKYGLGRLSPPLLQMEGLPCCKPFAGKLEIAIFF